VAELIWTDPALQDLDAIADYIALDKPNAARMFVSKVFEQVQSLKKFPRLGSSPPELPGMPYRQLVIPPCRIFYRIEENKVLIFHVMRGEQLLRPGLFKDKGQ
jgi:plasmid stabilization system protein ParE